MKTTSKIQLSRAALVKNFKFIRSILRDGVEMSCVVKGNAYGHGIEEYVQLAMDCGARHFSVFSADEAYRVRQVDQQVPLMIMGELPQEEIEWALEHNVEFFVFEFERLQAAIKMARKKKKKAIIHIELETGFNRTGFVETDLPFLADMLTNNSDAIDVHGVCTHFAGAESVANHVRVTQQIERFEKLSLKLENLGIHPKIKHTACSAATIAYPQTQYDLVRIGILQYGFWPSREIFIQYLNKKRNGDTSQDPIKDPLKRVISWTSRIMSTKTVRTGEFIGYGTSFLAQQDMRIASVPVGYSHGYSRVLSNQGRVMVNGVRVGVIGMVNMNVMMIDISEVDEVNVNDDVVLIGGHNETEITVASFGELSNQMNYELLTRLPMNIPRKIEA